MNACLSDYFLRFNIYRFEAFGDVAERPCSGAVTFVLTFRIFLFTFVFDPINTFVFFSIKF